MKKYLVILALLLAGVSAFAQEPVTLEQILQVNTPATLKAKWHQTRHSQLLTQNLVSDGVVYLQQPDMLRWETLSPIRSVSILSGQAPQGRFRLPSDKDFRSSIMEGEEYTVTLTPLRRDLKQLFSQITLKVQRGSLQITSALITSTDGDWSLIEFRDVQSGLSLSPDLFVKE